MNTSKTFEQALSEWLCANTDSLLVTYEGVCPTCGEVGNSILRFAVTLDTGASMGSGPWNAHSWQELRRCAKCKLFFVSENSNY